VQPRPTFLLYTLSTGEDVFATEEEILLLYRDMHGFERMVAFISDAAEALPALRSPLAHAALLAEAQLQTAPVAEDELARWSQRAEEAVRDLGSRTGSRRSWNQRSFGQILNGVGLSEDAFHRRLAEAVRIGHMPRGTSHTGIYRSFGRQNGPQLERLGFPAELYRDMLEGPAPSDAAYRWRGQEFVLALDEFFRWRSLPAARLAHES